MKAIQRLLFIAIALMHTPSLAAEEAANFTEEVSEILIFDEIARASLLPPEEWATDMTPEGLQFQYAPVQLNEMVNTIKDNELAAEIEYDGPFFVTARIDKITRSVGRPLIRLINKDDNVFDRTVSAFFDEEAVKKLAALEKGKFITVACQEWSYSMAVSFSECKLMSDVYKEYANSIEPRKLLHKMCKEQPSKATVMMSHLSKILDDVPPELKEDFANEAMSLESFQYLGRTGGLIESENYKDILNKVKENEALNSLFEQLESGNTENLCGQ